MRTGNILNVRYFPFREVTRIFELAEVPAFASDNHNAEALEAAVVREIAAIAEHPEMLRLLNEEAESLVDQEDERLEAERCQLIKKLTELEGQSLRWADSYSRGILEEEAFIRFNEKLVQEKTEVKKRLATIEASLQQRERREKMLRRVHEALCHFPSMWQALDMDERRNLLQLLCEKISIGRDGRDVILKLKLLLLPEREVRLMIAMGYRKKAEGKGPHTLTARHLALLYHIGTGKSLPETAKSMGITVHTMSGFMADIRKRMGVRDLAECARLAHERIYSLLPTLPIGRLRSAEKPSIWLTDKQHAIFPLLAEGATVAETAEIKSLSLSTITGCRKEIMRRLDVKTIYAAAQKARALGLLS